MRVVRKPGTLQELIKEHSPTGEDVMSRAGEEARHGRVFKGLLT